MEVAAIILISIIGGMLICGSVKCYFTHKKNKEFNPKNKLIIHFKRTNKVAILNENSNINIDKIIPEQIRPCEHV